MKKKSENVKKQIERKLKERRGQGDKADYKPWITVRDFGSRGVKTRIKGITTGRIHHLLSKLELQIFLCFDWNNSITDIKEQYPLNLKETLAIARFLKIKHPTVPGTNEPCVMTTDFLLTKRTKFGEEKIAINTKYAKELFKKRVIEKMEIERTYWTRRNIRWHVITEYEINSTLVRNIEWVHSFFNPTWLLIAIPNNIQKQVSKFLLQQIFLNNSTLTAATSLSDKYFGFSVGVSLSLVRYFLANRLWRINMLVPVHPNSTKNLFIDFEGGSKNDFC